MTVLIVINIFFCFFFKYQLLCFERYQLLNIIIGISGNSGIRQGKSKHAEQNFELIVSHKVKTQYVHFRLITSYFLFPPRSPPEMRRQFILKAVSTISNMCK